MKRILVTGGAGMIGSNLVKKLVRDKAGEVRVADNLWRGKRQNLQDETGQYVIDMEKDFFEVDLRAPEACERAVDGMDEIYHLADIVAGIEYVFANQRKIFHDNVVIDTNVLNAAAKAGAKRFLYMGTACSYPKSMQYGVDAPPLVEDDVIPAEPESAYGWSKLVGELQTELYGQETEMLTGILRCHNVYGTPTDLSPNTSQVIPALIAKAVLYPSQEFIVWGSGSQGRSFLHVDDVIDGLVLLMEKGMGNGATQIGTNYCTSIRELAEMIVKISGKNIEIKYDLSKPEGDKGRCADCTKAEKLLAWTPRVTLEEGLGRLYDWVETRLKG